MSTKSGVRVSLPLTHWLTKSSLLVALLKTLLPLLRVTTVMYCAAEQTSTPVRS